jgi:hypothetical protein
LQKKEAIADLLSPPAVHTYATIAAYRSEPRTSIIKAKGDRMPDFNMEKIRALQPDTNATP